MKIQNAIVLALGLTLVACASPAGGGGSSGSSGTSSGIPNQGDSVTFSTNPLPAPAYWNGLGHWHTLPNPFRFANGSYVAAASDWPARRAEISTIIQGYEYGNMPAAPDSVTFVDAVNASDANNITATISITVNGKTKQLIVGAELPTSANSSSPVPAVINCDSSNNNPFDDSTFNSQGWARITFNTSTIANENDARSGMVTDLFGYTYNPKSAGDLNNPSVNMDYAWGVSRIIDAIEAGAFQGKIDPKKLAITGFSRWGKAALVIGAFAKSQKGTQIAVTMPGSSGSGGTSLERFVTSAGITSDSTMKSTGLLGKTLYLKKITPRANNAANAGALAVTVVKGFAPFNESFDSTYNGWTDANAWGGIQSMAEARNETPSWFSLNFQQFSDLYYGLNLDYATDQPTRAPDGYLDTIPFDQHFVTSLIAPRALLFSDGFQTFRNNPESQYLNYLATREVYSLLGATNAIGIKFYNIPHEHLTAESQDLIDMGNAYFNNVAPPAELQAAPFPMDDPRSELDYARLEWAAPGSVSVKDQLGY